MSVISKAEEKNIYLFIRKTHEVWWRREEKKKKESRDGVTWE